MTSLDAMRARFARFEGLPFADIVTEANILDVLNEHDVQFRNRVFNPITTIWGFLSQVLSEDHSCRDTVSRIIAHRAANGETVCSPNTASYCKSRSRIPTDVLRTLATQTAEELQASAAGEWKWNDRSVFILDGSTVSMPDTIENQTVYPQPPSQKPGIGFPLARIALLLSLATGACHDLSIAAYSGKGTGEANFFRRIYDTLKPSDVVLADALFDDYFDDCLPPRRRPPRTLGTAGAETTTEAGRAANATSKHDQAAAQPVEMVLGHKSRNHLPNRRHSLFLQSGQRCHVQPHDLLSDLHSKPKMLRLAAQTVPS